jgi:hypothetical protein
LYFDWTFMGLVMPAFLFALWASSSVKATYHRYQKQHSSRGITGYEAARRILYENGLSHVRIERVNGQLTDHYDPRDQVIRLSDSVYSSTSTAAIGVAAHEAGHAVQHANNYAPLKLRNAIIPITNFGSQMAIPLFLLGLVLAPRDPRFIGLAYVGLIGFGLAVVFQLLTLPTEFNASKRALVAIEHQGILSQEELVGARNVLRAAAMTYVAALAVSLAQLLRFSMLLGRRR